MSTPKTLSLGSIWFVATFESGVIVSMEEHDWREGGWNPIPDDRKEDSNDYFLELVDNRTQYAPDRKRARLFVQTSGMAGTEPDNDF